MLINGGFGGEVVPYRGFHQGDPLSLVSFSFYALRSLLRWLWRENEGDNMWEIKIHKEAKRVNHLYVDDALFTCRMKSRNAKALTKVLKTFRLW